VGFGFALQLTGSWQGAEWERTLIRWLHAYEMPPWADQVMLRVTYAGTNLIMLPLLLPVALWLWKEKQKVVTALHLVVVALGSLSLNPSMKYLFGRDRPDLFPLRGMYQWASYPSGHAILTVALYFTIALQLRHARGWRWPFAVAAAIVLITCYSRVYLGVHWPTDLVGGVLIGAVWLAGTWRAFTTYYRRGDGLTEPASARRVDTFVDPSI
jgi:undecaprenyl-diphosphatase